MKEWGEGWLVGGVEVDDVGYGLLADGAEDGGGVGAHAAVFRAAPDALALVAAALVEADTFDGAASGAGATGRVGMRREASKAREEAAAEAVRHVGDDAAVREDGAGREHVLPFRREVGHRRDVGFPGLGVRVIHLDVLVVVEVFVGQTSEAVAELVDDDRLELSVMSRREGI